MFGENVVGANSHGFTLCNCADAGEELAGDGEGGHVFNDGVGRGVKKDEIRGESFEIGDVGFGGSADGGVILEDDFCAFLAGDGGEYSKLDWGENNAHGLILYL